jgi:hypothetical protein
VIARIYNGCWPQFITLYLTSRPVLFKFYSIVLLYLWLKKIAWKNMSPNGSLINILSINLQCYICRGVFLWFKVIDLRWDVIAYFVDINGNVGHHCFNFLFIMMLLVWKIFITLINVINSTQNKIGRWRQLLVIAILLLDLMIWVTRWVFYKKQ